MEQMRIYRCEILTTNALKDTCRDACGLHYNCQDGIFYVVTNDPKKIYEKFGPAIISITCVGIGYTI